MLRSSVSLGIRKLPRASILFIALCLSLIILYSYPRVHFDFQNLAPHQTNQTLDREQHSSNKTLELDQQLSDQSHDLGHHRQSNENLDTEQTPSHHTLDQELQESNKTLKLDQTLSNQTAVDSEHQHGNKSLDLQPHLTSQTPSHSPENTAQPTPLHHETEGHSEQGEKQGSKIDGKKLQHKERRFVLIIPATSPSPDLCKTILTALALGYPSPIIINWGIDYHAITKWNGGANLPKIPGFVKYLDAVMHPEAHPDEKLEEDDLVLMVDAYDVWFQLPAEILLRRYHAINKEANARLLQQWGKEEPMPMKQTVIAASGKNCHPQPNSGSNMHCERLPDSPLRADLYGPDTEKDAAKHRDHRPKYINGGVYIGPAGDMRRLFRRASQKMEAGIGQGIRLFSEQGIPGEVLGEQEVWRQWRRGGKTTISDIDAKFLMDRDFEYHFGLDYHQDLSIQTFWTDTDKGLFDGTFVVMNNQSVIDRHSAALGISPVRLKGLPEDIKTARNPLLDVIESPDWGDMPLYADFFTEAVPAIVHHNGFKERRTSWWEKPWLYQYLRPLLKLRMAPAEHAAPLAVLEVDGSTVNYWAPPAEHSNRKPRLMGESAKAPLKKVEFHDVCQYPNEMQREPGDHWWDEVFRDGWGP